MFPCCDSILIRVIALALTSGQELFTLYSCSLRLRHLRGGRGGGGGGGDSCDYLRIDTLAMKMSREGAWTVSWGRAFQSFTVHGKKELPEIVWQVYCNCRWVLLCPLLDLVVRLRLLTAASFLMTL